MANFKSIQRDPAVHNPPNLPNSGSAGVCMMNNKWKDEQLSSFINFISSFLNSNSFRLNIVPISPDFIFNCGELSVAFIFVTNWDCENIEPFFSRVQKLKSQFANLHVVVCLPTKEHNDFFVCSYFKCGMEFGKPTFVPVQDREMGFEKMIKIALSRGACKRQDVTAKLKAEKKQAVQGMNNFLKVVTSIPGIDNHDANALIQAIGSIEAIAKAPREHILENTDLSSEKVETITRFFRDPEYLVQKSINVKYNQ